LLRFGAELIFSICEAKQVEVVIVNRGSTFEEDLAKDGDNHRVFGTTVRVTKPKKPKTY